MTLQVIQGGKPDDSSDLRFNAAQELDIKSMADDRLIDYYAMANDEEERVRAFFAELKNSIKAEIEGRITIAGGRAIPHPHMVCELVDEYGPYCYDQEALKQAAALLPEGERSKVVKHVPEQVTIVAAHDEPGPAVSIAALIRKYGEDSDIGRHLLRGMTRTRTGQRLVLKGRKP